MGCENLSPPSNKSTLAWRIPWIEEPGGLQSMGLLQVGHNWATSLSHIREGNGNPLQCSCLENPRDGGAWWAAVYGVAQSQTRLRWLSSLAPEFHALNHHSLLSASWTHPSGVHLPLTAGSGSLLVKDFYQHRWTWVCRSLCCTLHFSFYVYWICLQELCQRG